MAKKTTKKPFKHKFIQEWGTYANDTLVYVGMSRDEIVKDIKKYEDNEDLVANLMNEETLKAFSGRGFVLREKNKTILWLNDWDNDWEYIEVLVHEIHHLVQLICVDIRNMSGEIEGLAYQQEYLLKEIRTKLNKKLFKK